MQLEINVKLRRGCFDLNSQFNLNVSSAGLYGRTGAGKSTLLKLIAGSLQPQSGYIVVDGKILFDSRRGICVPFLQRGVGAVFHLDKSAPAETVRDYLNAVFSRCSRQRQIFKPDFLIALLQLSSLLHTPLALLHDSDRHRVLLAGALLKSPKVLLLDDTFSMLTDSCRIQLIPVLLRLQQEFDILVLYASQSFAEILQLTDQLIMLEQGKVISSGSVQEIARQRDSLHYLGLRQLDNVLTIQIRGHDAKAGYSLATCAGNQLALPLREHLLAGSQRQISIRSHEVAIATTYIKAISIQNQIKGRICALIPYQQRLIVQVDCGCVLLAEITKAAVLAMQLKEGDWVYCLIKTHSIVYLDELEMLPQHHIVSYGSDYYLNLHSNPV